MSIELQISQKTTQQLLMSMQLRQAIKMLSLNNAELQEEIQKQINENPLLEVREENGTDTNNSPSLERRETDLIWSDFENNNTAEDKDFEPGYLSALLSQEANLTSQILEQINYTELNEAQRTAILALINNLDDNGYLNLSLVEIANQSACAISAVEEMLELLKSLDPCGIGAWDLRECLLIQLERKYPDQKLAFKIVAENLALLAEKKFQQLADLYQTDLDHVLKATKLIQSLEPRPIEQLSRSTAKYIVPDLRLQRIENSWVVQVNEDNLPNLAISQYYLNLINKEEFQSKREKTFFKNKFKEAGFFLQAILQRNLTLKHVAECIVSHQEEFFNNSINLKPLVLKDIAKELDIHESTVSRAVSDKFISTPKGIFPLRYFFSNKSSSSQEAASAQAVQNSLLELIKLENHQAPLSDAKLATSLAKAGIKIARRTVAKYREELGIPGASERKKDYSVKASL